MLHAGAQVNDSISNWYIVYDKMNEQLKQNETNNKTAFWIQFQFDADVLCNRSSSCVRVY